MYITKRTLNLGIVAHVDAGKTTITEQLLFKTGTISRIGRVDNGDTVTDSMALEKKRGITIKTTTVSFEHMDRKINLLDTPGHMDFIAEVERSLSVLDGVILAISAREGVQPQTRVLFSALKRLNIPTILFVNKVDRMGVDLEGVYDEIRQYLTQDILIMQTLEGVSTRAVEIQPFHKNMDLEQANYDQLALLDEAFLTAYFESSTCQDMSLYASFKDSFHKAFNSAQVYPILHGAALHGHGIEDLLFAMATWFDTRYVSMLFGKVYKVDRDHFGNRRCYLRLYGGELEVRKAYPHFKNEVPFKVRNLSIISGTGLLPVTYAYPGDIAVIQTDELKVEDILGAPDADRDAFHLSLPTMKAVVPTPDLGIRKRVLSALELLTDEDPFLDFSIHPITDAVEVHLFGVVQKEILEDLLKERFDLDLTIEEPGTVFLETPVSQAFECLRMYKDHFLPATVGIEIQPLARGAGIHYETSVSFGDLKKTFQNAVEEGARMALKNGPKGWRVTDCKIIFTFSEYDSVNSTPADYRKTAKEVVELALLKSGTRLIEPIMQYEISVPDYAIGRVMSDILKMEGTTEIPFIKGDIATLKGLVPSRTSRYYQVELADYTSGKGVLSTEFHSWRDYN